VAHLFSILAEEIEDYIPKEQTAAPFYDLSA
jgi:hypothetical protein